MTTFERFADEELLSARYADPYAQTHPMPRDRLGAARDAMRARKSLLGRDRQPRAAAPP